MIGCATEFLDIPLQRSWESGQRAKIKLKPVLIDPAHQIERTHLGTASIHTSKDVEYLDRRGKRLYFRHSAHFHLRYLPSTLIAGSLPPTSVCLRIPLLSRRLRIVRSVHFRVGTLFIAETVESVNYTGPAYDPCRLAHHDRVIGYVFDDYRVCPDPHVVTNSHVPDDLRSCSDIDVVADSCSPPRSRVGQRF